MKTHHIGGWANQTEENFTKAKLQTKQKEVGRIKSLYSYNIFDHPDYLQTQKIEKRIKKYQKKKLVAQISGHRMQPQLPEDEQKGASVEE